MASPRYRLLSHTADIRLVVWGRTEAELVRNAVVGAMAVALGAAPRGSAQRWEPIEAWPAALERRLVRAVNESLFYLYARRKVTVAVAVARGVARLGLAPLPATRSLETEVKAATFHSLAPRRVAGRLRATIILDL